MSVPNSRRQLADLDKITIFFYESNIIEVTLHFYNHFNKILRPSLFITHPWQRKSYILQIIANCLVIAGCGTTRSIQLLHKKSVILAFFSKLPYYLLSLGIFYLCGSLWRMFSNIISLNSLFSANNFDRLYFIWGEKNQGNLKALP